MSDQEYKLEELNFFRICYITTSIIRDGLETLFKQEWDRVYGGSLGTWRDTAKNGQALFNMESPRSRQRNNGLLRIIQNGNTKEWDSTCFFFAILYSDSLGPFVNPTVASEVDVLRSFRNTFAHSLQAHILEAEFQASVTLVTNAFTALHLDTTQLQNISSQKSFPTEELQQLQEKITVLEEELGEPKSFMCLPPRPSHEVIERKTETNEILQMFTNLQNDNDDASNIVTVYVHGNPGCGKSQIAFDVGKKVYDEAILNLGKGNCTFVMTLNGESKQSMLDSYLKFARELGVTEYALSSIIGRDSNLKVDERISHLKTLVSTKVKDYSTWLVIIDNANDLDSLMACWPDEQWHGFGKLLVTTQDSINVPFADPSCKDISLSEGMHMDDALFLLRSICGFSSENEEEEHSVVKEVDFQPLAIACAAIYVRNLLHISTVGNSTWKNYLKKVKMGKRHLTEKIYERANRGYPLSMTSAVTIAVEKLAQNEVFRHVVHFLGLGAPEPIDLGIIVSFVTKQDPALDEDITAADIAKCSLLIPLTSDDAPGTRIGVHKVVHDVFKRHILDKLSIEEFTVLTKTYIETLSPLVQHIPLQQDLEFHFFSKMIAPHLKMFISNLRSPLDVSSNQSKEVINTLLNFGHICLVHHYLIPAERYFELALEITIKEGESNDVDRSKVKATILNCLGDVLCMQGKFEKSTDHHQLALALFESLNPLAPTADIADSLIKLGNVSFSDGHFEEAKDYYNKSLEIRQGIFGTDHITVASCLNNLGCVYSTLGDHQSAKDFYQRSLELEERMFGKMHNRVADSLSNLGIEFSELGLTDEAFHYHHRAIEMRKELYFPNHFLISESYNNLGIMHKGMGQFEEAMHCFEAALCIREKVLPSEHPVTADLLDNLGQLCMEQGELEKAKEFHFRACDIRIKSLGSQHCKVGDSFLNLGLVHKHCFELDDATRFLNKALEIYSSSYPSDHHPKALAQECLQRISQQQVNIDNPGHGHTVDAHSTVRAPFYPAFKGISSIWHNLHWGRCVKHSSSDPFLLLLMLAVLAELVTDWLKLK
ncbi:uncharacterized protein [Porites lutea]|uniref:uncharacterized protein n=1 Tax=Porites lutea TaxID=51062 RepID=UPI003CC69F6A